MARPRPRWYTAPMSDLVTGASWYVVFLFSTTLHEAAHAWAALKGGDPTAYLGGQATLDPTPHVRREPVGMVALPLLSIAMFGWPFGYASAPYDPSWAARHPKRAALMALAGPFSNLTLAFLAGVAMRAGMAAGVLAHADSLALSRVVVATAPGGWELGALLLSLLFTLNLLLFVLNMIPLPPLDGSGAVPLVLSERLTARYQALMAQPMLSLVGLILAWNFFDDLFRPVFQVAIKLLFPEVSYG